MAKLIENLSWIADGEKATQEVFNRTLKELATSIDDKTFELLNKTSGVKLSATDIDDNVSDGDMVYISTDDGKYYQSMGGNDTTNKVIGAYTIIDDIPCVIWNGVITTTELTPGASYYLSNTEPGAITDANYEDAVRVGIALNTTELLVGISKVPVSMKWSTIYEATGGETSVTIPDSKTYTVGASELMVISEGVVQYIDYDYTEESATSVNFANALTEGERVMFQKI